MVKRLIIFSIHSDSGPAVIQGCAETTSRQGPLVSKALITTHERIIKTVQNVCCLGVLEKVLRDGTLSFTK